MAFSGAVAFLTAVRRLLTRELILAAAVRLRLTAVLADQFQLEASVVIVMLVILITAAARLASRLLADRAIIFLAAAV